MTDTAGPVPDEGTPAAWYRARRERFAAERERLTTRWNRIANLRLVAFAAAAACALFALLGGQPRPIAAAAWVASAALGGWFCYLVVLHLALGERRTRAGELHAVNDEALRRLARDWAKAPLRAGAAADPDHPYAADLDLFGRASLMHLLGGVATAEGQATLAGWLLTPAPPPEIHARQEAVRELSRMVEFREELALQGRRLSDTHANTEPFLRWAEDRPRMTGRRLRWLALLTTAPLWALLIGQARGDFGPPLWLPFAAANLVLWTVFVRGARASIDRAWSQEQVFRQYALLFELLTAGSFRSPLLRRLQEALKADGLAAHEQMRRLSIILRFVIPKSGLFYWPLQLLTMWDLYVFLALEGWRAKAGRDARRWLALLGEADALAALAALDYDNPDWELPEIDADARTVSARALGHPLLSDAVRVVNDVTVGPAGTFLLVTGSNMSGKSTLLRSIGVNIVLAQAGGPVCARAMRLPPVTLWTSMRIRDSLERGVSYFLAELQRLKDVVDASRTARTGGGPALFYLLDEILQGTNTHERQIAARQIVMHLVHQGALGAVSTHDLTLADTPELAAVARPIHFTETIHHDGDGPIMTFDYTLRPGIATSTNALRLMEIVGLRTEEARDEARP